MKRTRKALALVVWFIAAVSAVAPCGNAANTVVTNPAIKDTNCEALYIQVAQAGMVTLASQGEIHIADTTFSNSGSVMLDPGTYLVRVNNGKASSITVGGATVSNTNSNTNILAASDTYVKYFRQGTEVLGGFTPGQKISVSQIRNAFDFGGVLHSGEYNNSTITNELLANFDATVTGDDGMQSATEAVQGKPTMGNANAIAAFAHAHDMSVREHNFIWDDSAHQASWFRSLVSAQDSAKIMAALQNRVKYYIEPGTFTETDGYNELMQHTGNTVVSAIGIANVKLLYSQMVAAALGKVQIGMNQYSGMQYSGDSDTYVSLANQLAPYVNTMGIQYYVDGTYSLPTSMALLQNLNTTNLPNFLSEFGVQSSVSVSQSPTILNNLVRVMFGNPLSTGFYNWYWHSESGAFAPNSYFYDSSGKLTATGQMWQSLMSQYKTQSMTLTADANGRITWAGFYGDYLVNGKQITFAKGAAAIQMLAGDFNNDGVVNTADYVVWRTGLGTTYTQSDYAVWAANYGSTAAGSASGLSAGVAVPEISTQEYAFIGMGIFVVFLVIATHQPPRLH